MILIFFIFLFLLWIQDEAVFDMSEMFRERKNYLFLTFIQQRY